MTDKLEELQRDLGYFFKDEGLLCEALTHGSYRKSGYADYDNERYEFLGDRVLNLVMAEYFMEHRPEKQEGALTLLMAGVHDSKALSDIAYALGLQDHMYVSKGLIGRDFKRQRDRIVGDALEAILGVIFMDGGYASAKEVVLKLWKDKLANLDILGIKSAKSRLQEYAQKHKLGMPDYTMINQTGTVNNPTFEMAVMLDQLGKAKGVGGNKKEAEEAAAQTLLSTKDVKGE